MAVSKLARASLAESRKASARTFRARPPVTPPRFTRAASARRFSTSAADQSSTARKSRLLAGENSLGLPLLSDGADDVGKESEQCVGASLFVARLSESCA